MFDPITLGILGLGYLAFRRRTESETGKLTPEREEVFNNAMQHLHDPGRMLNLAKEFEKNGLKAQAHLLRKRAEWRARPEAVKAEHEALYQKALASSKPEGVLMVAQAFENMTATAKAGKLREHAAALQAPKPAPEAVQTPEPAVTAAPKTTNGAAHPSKTTEILTTAEPAPEA
jgi:hypothetical protein